MFPALRAPGLLVRPATRVLAVHAPYACRHSGACCEARWPIPLEANRIVAVQEAIAAGVLVPVSSTRPALSFPPDAPPGTPALLAIAGQACIFRDGEHARCRLHAALGHEALPLSCRQFPRVTILDPGGARVTLSHYCPTAASLLDTETMAAVVVNPAGFPADAEYVGLDAREALPPLLAPDMAMDWDAWWTWEARAVACFSDPRATVDDVLTRLRSAVEHIRRWRPGGVTLLEAMHEAFEAPDPLSPSRLPAPADRLLADVLDAVPIDLRPSLNHGRVTSERARRHFLSAHAFANWTAHLGRGLRTWLRSVEAADALLTAGLGVRQADLLLRHLADPYALARTWSRADTGR